MRSLCTFLLSLCMGLAVWAQSGFDPEKSITLRFDKGAVVVGCPAGAHLKASFMEVAKGKGPGTLKVGKMPPTNAKDELGDGVWHGTVRIPVTGEGLSGNVPLEVTYQPCTEGAGGNCFPPTTRTLMVKAADIPSAAGKAEEKAPAKAEASAAAPSAPSAPTVVAPASTPTVENAAAAPAPAAPAQDKGLLLSFLIVFLAGLGASLTPCVLPMIPITMAIIGAKGGGKLKGLLLSLMLVLGMAVTYTTLGVVAAKSGAAFGAFAQKPGFLIPVSVIFAIFALSLFGAFEIALPASLTNKLQGSGSRKGFLGAFIMGLVLGPLSAPCVGPIIGAVLVGIAQRGQVLQGALQLFTFSLGMGVLFIVAGTFSAGIPKSGNWLTRFKQTLGVVVLAFAAWNIRLIVPEWVNFFMWMVVTLVFAAVYGVFEPAVGLLGNLRKGLALMALILSLLLGVRAVQSAVEVPLLSTGATAAAAPAKAEGLGWMEQDLEAALAKAKADKKRVLVDIYAEWCAQCKELDHKTWPAPEVDAWIRQNAVPIRIDTDKKRPDLAKKLEIRSYPTVILLDAEGKEVRRSMGFQPPAEMLAWMNQK